ncbi:ribonuclease H-like YkuK family protein [Candidatus Jorgensenbacteria bacterium]|nr:ribonuclease H-like YkuK family protein [Candidatus Jorgensenbacteria bacterium]
MSPLKFCNSFGAELSVAEIVSEILSFMHADPKRRYKVVIGSDSEQLSLGSADFVTAVVVHRVGNGGRYFWRRIGLGRFHTLRDRIIQEVLLSLDVGKEFLKILQRDVKDIAWDFEIHVDVGERGETRSLIQEVVGMVRALNFEAKTKPESYAATKVADRHV